MNPKDFSNLSNQIRETLQEAVDSIDFQKVCNTVSETTLDFVDETKSQFALKKGLDSQRPGFKVSPGIRIKMVLLMAGGISLTILTTILLLLAGLFYQLTGWSVTSSMMVSTIFLLIGILLTRKGNFIRRRLKRIKKYLKLTQSRSYINLSELSRQTQVKQKKIKKDLSYAISQGILINSYLDKKQTCLILGGEAYQQYQTAELSYEQRLLAKPDLVAKQVNNPYQLDLKRASQAIKDGMVRSKLDRLGSILGKIFETLEKNPKKQKESERLIEYYLPTTMKLIAAYEEFEQAEIAGEHITKAKIEIEQTLDLINQAFERLFDHLYEDTVFDIATDVTVLQTMLKQDGWIDSDFK